MIHTIALLVIVLIIFGLVDCVDQHLSTAGDTTKSVFIGGASTSISGASVSTAFDFNGDGYDDYLIGAPGHPSAGMTSSGAAFLFYGSATQNVKTVNLTQATLESSALPGIFFYGGSTGIRCGEAVTGVGDFNNDTFDDIAISCPLDGSSPSAVFLLFGNNTSPSSVQLYGTSMTDFAGFRITGQEEGELIGYALAGGDLNDDGFSDLAIGSYLKNNYTGGVYIVFGSDTGFQDVHLGVQLQNSPESPHLHYIAINIDSANTFYDSYLGYSLAIGDLNRDGINDLAIGAPKFDSISVVNAGVVFVLYGGADQWTNNIELGNMQASNETGFRIYGSNPQDMVGTGLSYLQDTRGESGVNMLVMHGPQVDIHSTRQNNAVVYVMFDITGTPFDLAISEIPTYNLGYRILSPGNTTQSTVDKVITSTGVGDQTGDGIPDIAIVYNIYLQGLPVQSVLHVVAGKGSRDTADVDLAGTWAGYTVHAPSTQLLLLMAADAGDVNGDGRHDLLLSAPYATINDINQAGITYLLMGGIDDSVGAGTEIPSEIPSAIPSAIPSVIPSEIPSTIPSAVPSAIPSAVPSAISSGAPSADSVYVDYVLASKTFKTRNLYAFAAIHPATYQPVTWGSPKLGGNTTVEGAMVRIVGSTSSFLGVTTSGALRGWGMNSSLASWTAYQDATNIVASSLVANAGAYAALTTSGKVIAVGSAAVGGNVESEYWTKGFASYLSGGIVAIVPSTSAFAALTTAGTVYTWGSKFASGGISSDTRADLAGVVAIFATTTSFACLLDTGSVVTFGDAYTGGDSTLVSTQLTDVVHIVGAKSTFAAFKADRSLVTWGHPTRGGDSSAVATQLSSGVMHVWFNDLAFAALKDDLTVVTWGESEAGGDSSMVQGLLSNVTQLSATGKAFAALTGAGRVVTWGASSDGGVLPSNLAGTLSTGVRRVYATRRAFAALKHDGSVHVWGNAYQGGAAYAVSSYLTTGVKTICANEAAFTAIKSDGTVVTWGHMTVLGVTGGKVIAQNPFYANITSCV